MEGGVKRVELSGKIGCNEKVGEWRGKKVGAELLKWSEKAILRPFLCECFVPTHYIAPSPRIYAGGQGLQCCDNSSGMLVPKWFTFSC